MTNRTLAAWPVIQAKLGCSGVLCWRPAGLLMSGHGGT